MLDQRKVMLELQKSLPSLFKESEDEYRAAKSIFNWLREHPEAIEALKKLNAPYPLPSWSESIDKTYYVERHDHPYTVLATDGSQIYPDKHQGISCSLVNTGVAHFSYDHSSEVRLFSKPSLYTYVDESTLNEDMINCLRGEKELELGLEEAAAAKSQLFLCDGSLIFWHLESKSPAIRDRFFKRYCELLLGFYKENLLIAGYISLPKSKELVSLLRNCLMHSTYKSQLAIGEKTTLDTIIDSQVMSFYLPKFHRSQVFVHNSSLAELYPAPIRPCFLYLNIDTEIVRIEIPAYIAQNDQALTKTLKIIMDQCVKGNGYPVALSEAHEQAVVSAREREFFFEMLYKMGLKKNYRSSHSQKSLKKRYVSI